MTNKIQLFWEFEQTKKKKKLTTLKLKPFGHTSIHGAMTLSMKTLSITTFSSSCSAYQRHSLYMRLGIKTLFIECYCVECHYVECRDLFIVMLNVFMLSVVTFNVVSPHNDTQHNDTQQNNRKHDTKYYNTQHLLLLLTNDAHTECHFYCYSEFRVFHC